MTHEAMNAKSHVMLIMNYQLTSTRFSRPITTKREGYENSFLWGRWAKHTTTLVGGESQLDNKRQADLSELDSVLKVKLVEKIGGGVDVRIRIAEPCLEWHR